MKPHSEVKINRKTQLATIHRYGDMTLEQMVEGVNTLFSTKDFAEATNIISDLSHASLTVTGEEVSKYAEYCKDLFENSSHKIVVIAPDTVDYGLARMFAMLSELTNVRIVKTHTEAYDWLDIPMQGL